MKKSFIFTLTLIISGLIILFVTEGLFKLIHTRLEWIQPIIALSVAFFWIEYFKIKDNQRGLWQIVSVSTRDRLSLIVHLAICTFVTAWINQINLLPIYRFLIWLVLVFIICVSFYLTSTQEAKPLIKRYFFEKL